MRTIIAIDPGASGGIAVAQFVNGESQGILLLPLPETEGDRKELLSEHIMGHEAIVYLEHVTGMIRFKGRKKDGSAGTAPSMFNFGMGYGLIKGIVLTLQAPLNIVTPQKWQKDLAISEPSGPARKKRLKARAQELFPNIDRLTNKTCDALLILRYAAKQEGLRL